ncbi:hypothetical protein A5714_03355 [Mycobacterium sp. E2462]|nr:hypothetical protein A5714_03355 [Mycobacterium sp. E2462]
MVKVLMRGWLPWWTDRSYQFGLPPDGTPIGVGFDVTLASQGGELVGFSLALVGLQPRFVDRFIEASLGECRSKDRNAQFAR